MEIGKLENKCLHYFGKLRFFIWQKVEHTPSVLVTPLYLHKDTIYIKLNSFGNTVAYILFKIVF